MTRVRVCHITSAHIPLDGRIFYHECKSLAELYDVTLVCASNEPSRTVDGVHIVSAAPRSGGRAARWRRRGTLTQAAEETSARIFHFHDPELLPHMVRLGRATGSPVVYDVHEHYPDAVMQRAWVPAYMRTAVSKIADRTERRHAPQCDAVVCADEALVERFAGMSVRRPVLVRNFPTAGMGANLIL